MAALDLLGHRWSLRVLWELRSGPVGARALLARCLECAGAVLQTASLKTPVVSPHERHAFVDTNVTGRGNLLEVQGIARVSC